jgi:Sec-independent protein secretion pathway component TatC
VTRLAKAWMYLVVIALIVSVLLSPAWDGTGP